MSKKEIGKVNWFERKKGYGFVNIIDPESELYSQDVFVHFTSINCENSFKTLYPGEIVSLEVQEDNDTDKKYKTSNITGLFGTKLMVDNEKYMIKVLKRRDNNEDNKAPLEGADDGDADDGGADAH
tara:strand:+ start:31 stop:408 length:378 start_codon:yes stop_codon:yes gene_type:complete